jgi:hypothetical protein
VTRGPTSGGVFQGTGEFERDYPGKYEEGLNTFSTSVSCLVSIPCADTESGGAQANLFPAAISAFIFCIKSKLEPDPNETTVAYIPVSTHAVNGLLFPDVDLSSVS